MPSRSQAAMNSSSAAGSPLMMVCEGPLIAAMLNAVTPGLQARLQFVGAQQDRRHAAGTAQAAQRLTAPRHHLGGLGQGKHPGDIGRGDLALGVADHRVGNNAVAAQHLGQRNHHREQHRLDHIDSIQRRGRRVLTQDLAHRPAREGAQRLVAVIDGVGEDAVVFVELSTHAGVLAALAGEDEHGFAAQVGQVVVLGQLRVGLAGAQGVQGVQQVFARIGGWPPAR